MSEQRPSNELAKYLAHLAGCTRGALKGEESRMMRITLKDSEAIQTAADLLSTAHEPPATLCVDPAFDGTRCPFTKLPYFMHLDHPELGRVPTYGGPYDSYTIPVPDDDNERTLRSERYDHDEGAWIEGGMPWPMNLVTNEEFVDLHTLREERASQPPSGLRDQMWAYLDAIGAPRDGLAKQSINAFLMWMEDRTSETKPACDQCRGERYTADSLPCTACNAMGEAPRAGHETSNAREMLDIPQFLRKGND